MKKIFALLSLVFAGLVGFSQPVYNASSYADPGDNYVVTKVFAPQLAIHRSTIQANGASQNWDFSFMQGGVQRARKFYNPVTALDYTASYIAMCNLSCLTSCLEQCADDGDSCRAGCTGFFPLACTTACNGVEAACSTSCPGTCSAQCTGNTLNWNLAEKRRPDLNFSPLIDFRLEDRYNIMGVGNPLPIGGGGTLTNWAIASRIGTSLLPGLPTGTLPIMIPYTDPDDVLKFPITYGDSHTDHSEYGFDLGSIGSSLGLTTDFGFVVSKDRQTEVVGYGTIQTPYGTYTNALKVRTVVHKEYDVMIEGIRVNTADWPDLLDPINEVEYLWFDAAEGIPVFRVFGHVEFGLESYECAEYLDNRIPYTLLFKDDGENIIGEDDAVEDLVAGSLTTTVYPNPFTEDLNIRIISPVEGRASVRIFNAMGQLVREDSIEVAANTESFHTLSLEKEVNASGLYIVRVQIGDEYVSINRALKK